ncbi:MAG TPA: ABC transporter permease [Bryobacteraceae bacterium]|nr:ABC transporter permease [Bryobacteraceae bacterium]
MSQELAVRHGAWSDTPRPLALLLQMMAVAEADVRKLLHDPVELFSRMLQPILWLVIFAPVFSRTRAIPTGGLRYLDFMAPGVLAQSVMFGAIFYGISVIWERDQGVLQKFLVSPAPRFALVAGRAFSSTLRGVVQTAVVYVIALLMGVKLQFGVLPMACVLLSVVLGAATFSTLSLVAACLVKSRERFMGIGQVMTMPLFFASNAIYPLSMMPEWLRILSRINPLSYQVDLLRASMIRGGASVLGFGTDIGVQLLWLALLLAIATKLYPRIAF